MNVPVVGAVVGFWSRAVVDGDVEEECGGGAAGCSCCCWDCDGEVGEAVLVDMDAAVLASERAGEALWTGCDDVECMVANTELEAVESDWWLRWRVGIGSRRL